MEDESYDEHRQPAEESSTQTNVQRVDNIRQGVSGGNLHDSIAVGDSHGDVNLNRIHGNRDVHFHNNIINVNVGDKTDYMEQVGQTDNSLAKGVKGSSDATEKLVHPEKGYTLSRHPEDVKQGHGPNNVTSIGDNVSETLPTGSYQSTRHSSVHGELIDLGIQIRDTLTLEDVSLRRERDSGFHAKRRKVTDSQQIGNTPDQGLQIISIDLRKVKPIVRLKTKESIEMTVQIAKIKTTEIENIYYFLERLYGEMIEHNESSNISTHVPGSMVQPYIDVTSYDTFVIDLNGISNELFQFLTNQNVKKIVFLTEISPDKSGPISEFITRIYFELARVAMRTI